MTDQKCQQPGCPGTIRMAIRDFILFDFLDDKGDPTGNEIRQDVVVYIHICDMCGEMVDIGIEDPCELDAGVAEMRAAIENEIKVLTDLTSEYGGYDYCNPILQEIIERLEGAIK